MNALIMQKTKETILHASQKSDTAILFFSATGKDSIVLLHLLQSQFKKVVCCFLYHVKGLNIVEGKVVYKAVADVFGISKK